MVTACTRRKPDMNISGSSKPMTSLQEFSLLVCTYVKVKIRMRLPVFEQLLKHPFIVFDSKCFVCRQCPFLGNDLKTMMSQEIIGFLAPTKIPKVITIQQAVGNADHKFGRITPTFILKIITGGLLAGGYFSQTLRCHFTVRTVQFNGYTVRAARLVSNPEWGSPLRKLGLRQGDVIFRLDGVPVSNNYELDNHYSWTTVRYSRQGVSQIENGKIYIDNQQLADNSDDFLGQR